MFTGLCPYCQVPLILEKCSEVSNIVEENYYCPSCGQRQRVKIRMRKHETTEIIQSFRED